MHLFCRWEVFLFSGINSPMGEKLTRMVGELLFEAHTCYEMKWNSSHLDSETDISIITLRPRQNCGHFKPIFLNENIRVSIKISLKFVPKVFINNILALVQIMAWRWPGDKPLSEPMMVCWLTHICVTRPQWVKPANLFHTRVHLFRLTKPAFDLGMDK